MDAGRADHFLTVALAGSCQVAAGARPVAVVWLAVPGLPLRIRLPRE